MQLLHKSDLQCIAIAVNRTVLLQLLRRDLHSLAPKESDTIDAFLSQCWHSMKQVPGRELALALIEQIHGAILALLQVWLTM